MWDHCQYKDLSSFIICLFRSRPRLLQESSSTPVEAPLWTVARCPATWRPSTRWRTWAWPWLRSGALTTPSTPLLMLWTSWFLASSSVSTQSLLLALEPSQVDSNKVRNYLSTLFHVQEAWRQSTSMMRPWWPLTSTWDSLLSTPPLSWVTMVGLLDTRWILSSDWLIQIIFCSDWLKQNDTNLWLVGWS